MKGTNEIIFNHSTMTDIVEYWLRHAFVHHDVSVPKVVDVRAEDNGVDQQFRVRITSAASQ